MRGALRAVFTRIPPEELAKQLERGRLILSVPELRMRFWDQIVESFQMFATVIAKRVGRPASDIDVITFTGAVGGALLAAMLASMDDLEEDFVGVIDSALAYLEADMPLMTALGVMARRWWAWIPR